MIQPDEVERGAYYTVARCTTASDEQLTELFAELHAIDPVLTQDMTQKKTLEEKADLQAFVKTRARL